VRERNIESIAIPPLGCGLGGLKWNDVRPLIEDAFAESPEVRVLVYEPCGAPAADKMVRSPKKPRMTHGRAALLGLMRRYLAAVMDPQITLLEIHKLMFFMQESGEPLKLRYTKGPYGPYAENLRHVLNLLEGHYICGYGDAEDDPNREIELMPRAAEQAEVYLADHPDTRQRFNRVVDLISGFESSYGMELLTTVDWVCRREGARTLEEAVDKTWAWNDRKRMFPEQHIVSAWETLRQQGWLATESCGNGGEGHGSSR
ncbi:MAG: Appr-1-p processing protein, partial [Maioricimonas sp. JB045]